jgi:transglutaminase-like putative cysteine protease
MQRLLVCGALLSLCTAAPLRAGGEWFSLSGFSGYAAGDPAHPLAKALQTHAADKKEFRSVAITPRGEWVLLLGTNGAYSSNADLPAVKAIVELQKTGQKVNGVAFTPNDGWVVLCDTMPPRGNGIPGDAMEKMEEFARKGYHLRSITFLPNGGWVLLVNDNGVFWSGGLPGDLKEALEGAYKRRVVLRCVAVTTFGDWFVLADRQFWTNVPEHPLAKQLTRQTKSRQLPKWICLAPEDPATARLRLETKPAQRVRAELTSNFFADGPVEEYALFAPRVESLPGQRVDKMSFEPAGEVVYEDGPGRRALTLSRITDGRQSVSSTLTLEATLMSRRLRPQYAGEGVPAVADLTPEELRQYTTAPIRGAPDSAPVRQWMQNVGLTRRDEEGDLAYAYRTFQYIRHHFRYECPVDDQSPVAVCTRGKSDCAGLSGLFIRLLRENGVAARALTGRFARSGKKYDGRVVSGDNEGREHVRVEFFAKGVGWVPVELAAAVSVPHAADLTFFGNDAGDLVTLAHDPYGLTDTVLAGKQSSVACQSVFLYWRSSSGDQKIRREITWTVTKLPDASR